MNNKTVLAIKIVSISTIIIFFVIAINLIRHKEEQAMRYESNHKFSVVVSEDKWDESTMPKGRRSPKGVLYNPEK